MEADKRSGCPLCGSELYIDRGVTFCPNPHCRYQVVEASVTPQRQMSGELMMGVLPFAILFIAVGVILVLLSLFFSMILFILFLPLIIPISLFKRLVRRRKASSTRPR